MDFTGFNNIIFDFIICRYGEEKIFYHFLSNKTEMKPNYEYVIFIFEYLLQKNFFNDIERVSIFSDGCKYQFKNRYFQYFLTTFISKINPTKITHSFFVSNHGHNPCDAEAGVMKRTIRKLEKIKCSKIIKLEELKIGIEQYEYTKKKKREFIVIDTFFDKKNYNLNDWVNGMTQYHYFEPISIGTIKCKLNNDEEEFVLQNFVETNNSEYVPSESDDDNDDNELQGDDLETIEENILIDQTLHTRVISRKCCCCSFFGLESVMKQCYICKNWFHDLQDCIMEGDICFTCSLI
jgi:hypothetical protein